MGPGYSSPFLTLIYNPNLAREGRKKMSPIFKERSSNSLISSFLVLWAGNSRHGAGASFLAKLFFSWLLLLRVSFFLSPLFQIYIRMYEPRCTPTTRTRGNTLRNCDIIAIAWGKRLQKSLLQILTAPSSVMHPTASKSSQCNGDKNKESLWQAVRVERKKKKNCFVQIKKKNFFFS